MPATLETTTTTEAKETFVQEVEHVAEEAVDEIKHLAHEAVDDVENLLKHEHSGTCAHSETVAGSDDNASTVPSSDDQVEQPGNVETPPAAPENPAIVPDETVTETPPV